MRMRWNVKCSMSCAMWSGGRGGGCVSMCYLASCWQSKMVWLGGLVGAFLAFAFTRAGTRSPQGPRYGAGGEECRCIPSLPCWPTLSAWAAFNDSLSGRLVLNHPVAAPCYPGALHDTEECSEIKAHATNNTFLQNFPVGYSYPLNISCPVPAQGDNVQGSCELGSAPLYTVNATTVEDVIKGINFARERNLRLVVRDTGHDLLGRSSGFGGLQIWIRYLRTGIDIFEEEGEWRVRIGGGYVWSDVYPIVAQKGLMVVGGGTPSVGCLGGWMQGGGHSPLTHDYGLGADQVLEAKVVLANGSLVTASPSQNKDLFFAIRGGGPGTYGIVVETIVKAYPTLSVVAQTLAFAPLDGTDVDVFFETLTELYMFFPSLAKGGWSGFGQWCVDCAQPAFGNFSTGYTHSFANFKKALPEAKEAFNPILEKLRRLNGTKLFIDVQYAETVTYAEYYEKFSGVEPPAGGTGSTSGRFLDEEALTDQEGLEQALRVVAGKKGEYTTNVVEFFGAPYGQIGADGKKDPVSGVNPSWRTMILNQIVARYWTQSTSEKEVQKIQHDVESVKIAALKKLAPNTGTYMNEGNRLDPDWKVDFYGSHHAKLDRIKRSLDPEDVFYCPTCVGSDRWEERSNGQLCRRT